MKNKIQAIIFSALFVIWTVLVCFYDVAPIGPNGSSVGLSKLNSWWQSTFAPHGVRQFLYGVSDGIGYGLLAIALGFAIAGLVQWIKRKNIWKVDVNILLLGVLYAVTIGIYVLAMFKVVNYRPILIDGELESSYPSSHTMLALVVLGSGARQAKLYLDKAGANSITVVAILLALLLIASRACSGVHWISDIVGSILISAMLLCIYNTVLEKVLAKSKLKVK